MEFKVVIINFEHRTELEINAEQAKWYLKAAEGGYVRAMYNVSLCYSVGEGFAKNHPQAKKWMKRAADHGHSKAQFEHGLNLFSVCSISPRTNSCVETCVNFLCFIAYL